MGRKRVKEETGVKVTERTDDFYQTKEIGDDLTTEESHLLFSRAVDN